MDRAKTSGTVDRHGELRKLIAKGVCTHILISDPIDVEYVTGFHSSNVFLLVHGKKSILATDFRYRQAAGEFCRAHAQWHFVEIGDVPYSFLSDLVRPTSRLGIQSNHLTLDQYDRLKRQCPGVRFVKLNSSLPVLFMPKLPEEIEAMQRAARIGDMALDRLKEHLKTGMTERQAAAMLESQCRQLGSDKPSFDTIVLFGARSALPHGVPGGQRLKTGNFVLVDFGCTVEGLCSDMTRTFVFGKAGDRQKQIYETVLQAQEAARRAARAGIAASAVDAAARAVIDAAGFGEFFRHATGHGVGRRVHERPRIGKTDQTVLPEGTTFTIEPGIYVPDLGGVRIEDMVVATATGARVLTRSPRDLIEIAP